MKQITLFFAVQGLRRKPGVYIFNEPPGDDKWNSKSKKDTQNPKKSPPLGNTLL